MNQTNLKNAIRCIVGATEEARDVIRSVPADKRTAVLVSSTKRLWEDYYPRFTDSEPPNSEWRDLLRTLIDCMETVLREARHEADYTDATEELVSIAIGQGINPDVARRAGELQTAVHAAGTDPDVTRRIRTLVMPLAREAGYEAKRGHHQEALALTEQAFATLREITTAATCIRQEEHQ